MTSVCGKFQNNSPRHITENEKVTFEKWKHLVLEYAGNLTVDFHCCIARNRSMIGQVFCIHQMLEKNCDTIKQCIDCLYI
jgi:hypothetical protein